jgi:dipeptidyl aminopeptidase/acylaminoacyl peptidase
VAKPTDHNLSQLPPLIPRDLLLGNPERWHPTLAPDGSRIAWIAPDKDGVRQVWVSTRGADDQRCVTADRRRGIIFYGWAWDSTTILYIQDSDGDENYHMFGVDLTSGNVRDLTPWQGVRCEFVAANRKYPDELLLALNVRDRSKLDVWRVSIANGEARLDTKNPGDVLGWLADDDMVVRVATAVATDGAYEVRIRKNDASPWQTLARAGADEEVFALGFSRDGRELFLKSSIGSGTLRVISRNLESGAEREIAERADLDAEGVIIHPIRREIEAIAFAPGRREWRIVDPAVAGDFEALAQVADGDFAIAGREESDHTWIVEYEGDRIPPRYFLWDRATRRASFMFSSKPELDNYAFAPTNPVRYRARDGMELHAYLTLPAGLEGRALPMVLFVHGGPWARDYWGYNAWVQILANRGYAVLQPNYRGSTGYGKKYLHAGDLQWGRAMQDDLTDAVGWAVAEKIADPGRVAIFGGSYGGYAALAGATFTPDLYTCAVDLVGPSSLFTLLSSVPPYWLPIVNIFKRRMGDLSNPAHTEMLRNASLLFSAERIRIPMLIAQGANDPRVTQQESEQIVAAIEKNGGSATYVLYPDEGHGFARPENNIDFMARVERFLAEHLGGRFEPMAEERTPGSTAIVRVIGS